MTKRKSNRVKSNNVTPMRGKHQVKSNNVTPMKGEQRTIVHRQEEKFTFRKVHKGPLPAPEVLEQYENILPGAADRIIMLAENQAKHRQDLEKIAVKGAVRDSLLGLIFAFVFCIFVTGGAIFSMHEGNIITGTILGGVGLVTVVTAFIQGRSNHKDENS